MRAVLDSIETSNHRRGCSVKRRRGINIPLFAGLAIVLFFAGRHSWKKYQTSQWLDRTKPALSKTRNILDQAFKGTTYPVFSAPADDPDAARANQFSIRVNIKALDEEDQLAGVINASEKQREVATWCVCTKADIGGTHIVWHRLYMDNGKPFGEYGRCVAPLYLERRRFDLPPNGLGSFNSRRNGTTGDHTLLVRSTAQVRLTVEKRLIKSLRPAIGFKITCRQPVDGGEKRVCEGDVQVQTAITFLKRRP